MLEHCPYIPQPPKIDIALNHKAYKATQFNNPIMGLTTQVSAGSHALTFSRKYFTAKGFFGKLSLERYYKDDWSGVFVRDSSLEVDVITMDCSHTKQAFKELATVALN